VDRRAASAGLIGDAPQQEADFMTKDHTKTVLIRKPGKVAPDERGRSVWLGKVEAVELELVSTTALQKILKSKGGEARTEIQKLAAGRKDGVLARDTATGHFRIVTETTRRAAAELSLVSTQILRKVLKPDGKTEVVKAKPGKKDKFGGFNPYDNN
jgi:hypothetical protein